MSTPSPELVAASPVLKAALTDLKQFLTTVLTGDPIQIPARLSAANLILLGQLQLLLPSLATAEESTVLQQGIAGIDNIIGKLP